MLGLSAASDEVLARSGAGLSAFRWEREMLPPLLAAADSLVPHLRRRHAHVLTEVASASGVPDLVVLSFDQQVVAERLAAGLAPVEDLTQVRALVAAAGGARTVDELAAAAQVTRAYLRGNVLPALVQAGWLKPTTGRGCSAIVEPRHLIRSVAADLVTVEAKRTAWQRAVNQAMRHALSADACYIALDAARATPAIAQRAAIGRLGVGLLTVDPVTCRVAVVARPRCRPYDPGMRTLLAERAWQLVLSGKSAGPTFPVFGRDLTVADRPADQISNLSHSTR